MSVSVRLSVRGSTSDALRRKLRSQSSVLSRAVVAAWGDAVRRSRLSSRAKERYIRSIQPYRQGVGAYISDKVAALLEKGWERFDMKPGLLRAKSRRAIPLLEGEVIRTVSVNSPAGFWIHPGFDGAKVVDKVQATISAIVARALK